MKIAEAFVELRVDRAKAEREAKTAAQGAFSAMRQVFSAGLAIAGIKEAIGQASDLNETISKTGVVFGDSARDIEAWSTNSARSMGLSQRAALDAASTFAIFGKSAGLAGTDLTSFSTDLTGLASDLASFNNTSPEEAILAIGAALRGESEPIRQYGVLLDDATLKQRALTMGIYDGEGALTQQQRVLAAQEEILAQTSLAQGDFARTADGVANSQRIAKAEAENTAATIGQTLLPVYQRALEIVTFLVDRFGELPAPVQTALVAMAGLALVAGPIGAVKDTIVGVANALINVAGSGGRAVAVLAGVGGVLAAAGLVYWAYASDKARAEQVTNDFVMALEAETSGQKDAVKALIARQIAESKYLDTATQLGLSTADTAKVITGQSVPAYDELRAKFDEIIDSADGYDRKLLRLKDTFGVNANELVNYFGEVDRLNGAYGAAVTQTEELEAAEAALGIATDDVAASTEAAVGPVEDLADAQAEARDRFREATKRMDDQREALGNLYDELIGQVDQQRAYERAVDDSEDAARQLTETLANEESTLVDIRDASRNAADAAIDQAKAYAELEAGSTTSAAGVDAMITSLYNQAVSLAPDSPLRAELLNYIGELQKIPTQIDTTIRLRVTGQTVTRDGDIIGIRALPGEAVASARGRYVPAGANLLSTFGEEGPEAILPLDKPNQLVELLGDPRIGGPVAAAMGGGGGGGSTLTMPVTVFSYGTEQAYVESLARELHTLARSMS